MKKKKDVSAYMTVEVSLLFPIILLVLLCVIYLSFYSYNKTIAFQNAGICALYGKNGFGSEGNKEKLVEKMYGVLEILNEGQYVASKHLKQHISVEKNQIKVCQEGNVNIPLLNPDLMSELNFSEEVNVSQNKAVFYIRQLRKVKKNEVGNNFRRRKSISDNPPF